MRVILAGFEGEDNSSKKLLDCVNAGDQKIYLKNDKMICVKQVIDVMEPGDRIDGRVDRRIGRGPKKALLWPGPGESVRNIFDMRRVIGGRRCGISVTSIYR